METSISQKEYGRRGGVIAPQGHRAGFTLVEMIVAVALFAVVMTVAGGSLLSIVDANRKAQAIKSVMNNLNFALESMARNLRVGGVYSCGGGREVSDCAEEGATSIGFTTSAGERFVYALCEAKIVRITGSGTGCSSAYEEITAPEITVDRLRFYVSGTAKNDGIQPKILMVVGGEVNIYIVGGRKERTKTRFDLQTLISQRASDRE